VSPTTDALPDDGAIEQALEALGVPLGAAEAHGLACGLLCSLSGSRAKSRWFSELVEAGGLAPESLVGHTGALRALEAWFATTDEALNSSDLTFEPRLPDDEQPMAQRTDALADFCAGFTYGLGLGSARRGNASLPEDTREIVRDLQAIDGAQRDERVDEADYAELVEYVRVGVLVVLEELRPVWQDPQRAGDAGPAVDGADALPGATGRDAPLH